MSGLSALQHANSMKGSSTNGVRLSRINSVPNSVMSDISPTPICLQRKLTVNTPGDKYEEEADRVAEQVMRTPAATSAEHAVPVQRAKQLIQRQPEGAASGGGPDYMVGAGLNFRFGAGSQNISKSASIRLFGVIMNDFEALEAGIELFASKNQRVFGVDTIKAGDYGLRLKWTVQATFGENQGFVGMEAGARLPAGPRPEGDDTSWSIGVGGDYALKLPSEVSSMANKSHSIKFSASHGNSRKSFSTANDIFISDKGPTAGAKLSLEHLAGDQVQSAGLNFDMITPAPTRLDTTRKIRGSNKGTYETEKPDAYHGNWYLSGTLRTDQFQIDVELGADSTAGGRIPQDIIHKYFLPFIGQGESGLFEWPARPTTPYWNLNLEGGPDHTIQRQNIGDARSGYADSLSLQAQKSDTITAPPIVNDVLRSSGSPLPSGTQTFMESRFGHEFSHVRVHTDKRAAESAAAIQARAYTVGNNIVFGRGESPTRDQHLLAHELTHVLQQGFAAPNEFGLSRRSNALQREESKKDNQPSTDSEQEEFKKRVAKSETYRSIIEEAFREYSDPAVNVTVDDLVAMVAAESSGKPDEVSGKHRGLFQLSRDNTFDSVDMAKARKSRFNKTAQDRAFSWDDKKILDPTINIRYGVFVIIERRRQAAESIERKAKLETEKSGIENDRNKLEEEKKNIPTQLQYETDESKKTEMRKRRGELRGEGIGFDNREKENTKQLKEATDIEPGNIKLKAFIANNPAAASYLLHQQGVRGLRNLLVRENEAIEKNQKDNLPDTLRKTIKTKKAFVDYWVQRYEKFRRLVPVTSKPTDSQKQIQPKLKVNTPGDKYEIEADHISEQIMRMPEPQVQRQCACDKSSTEGACSECKKEKREITRSLQRVASSPVGGIAAPPIVNEVLSSPGSPLPTTTRSFMETRFGQDFSHVRVHTDQLAAESAASVQAKAYTVGNHIAFGQGNSPSDKLLLAHELTHTVQQVSGVRSADMLVARKDNRDALQNQDIPQQTTKPEIKFRIHWLVEGGIPVETNGQVAVMARLVIASFKNELGDVESATVAARVEEWITTVEGVIPYFDRHAGEKIHLDLIPLINHQYDELLKVRAAVQQDKLTQIKDALWREHDASLMAAEEAEALQPALDDALRAAYRKGSTDTVKEVVSTVKGALSIGRNLQKLAAEITNEITGLPIPSGTKIYVDHWTSQIGTPKITIVNISKYTDMLAKLGRGLSALSVVLTIADRSKKATEAEQGVKDLSDAVNISTDLISASPLSAPPHFALYSTLYLKPALKIIAKQFGMLVENLSDYNRASVEVTGDLMYPAAEPGGQEMFNLMITVMHAEDEYGLPALPSGVKEYLFDHREKLSTGTEADVPTEGALFWKHVDSSAGRHWLFENRNRVWAMFYGSLKPPKKKR